jgi:rhodanese-related sulfurtransferase
MDFPWWLPFGPVPEIGAAELARAVAGDAPPLLVDVRTWAEHSAGHVAGAVHVPVTSLPAGFDSLALDRARPVVAICLTAHRSIPAVRLLRRRGFDARQLRGGMLAWRAAGLPERRPPDDG